MKKKIIKETLPSFLKPFLENIESFDYRYFNSFHNEIKSSFEKKIDNTDFKQIKIDFFEFIKEVDFKEMFNTFKEEMNKNHKKIFEKDQRSILLLELIEKADKLIPNVSIVILTKRIDYIEHQRKTYEPVDLIEEINKNTGEHRARLAVRFFREVSEMLYDDYLRILWDITNVIKKGELLKSTDSFGILINNLSHRLKIENKENLIEKDAGWIRNAASHASYVYKVDNDSLIMWDKNKPKKEIKVDELISKASSMYIISSEIINEIYIYYLFKLIYNNDFIEIVDRIKENFLKKDKKPFDEFHNYFVKQFGHLKKII